MTPEREAQMRAAFEKEMRDYLEKLIGPHCMAMSVRIPGEYAYLETELAWSGFLACARALEPMARDGERYRFLRTDCIPPGVGTDQVLVVRKGFYDGRILVEENLDTAIDSAMSAALEDGNATE